ncbi:MAG: LysR family transcriptional regulator [Marinomonas sp.]
MRNRQLEIFYHVYRAGSISGAARDLNVSQPSVSKVLRHTEDQLGIELFQRSKGRLKPTPAADELFGEADDLYGRLASFNRSLDNIRQRRGGHMRLSVLPSLSLSVGPELISRMRVTDDSLSFELTTLHSADLARVLLEKQSDLSIGFEPIHDSRILTKQVGTGAFAMVSAHALHEGNEQDVAGLLANEDFIGIQESGPLGGIVEQELLRRDIVPKTVITAHTYHVALSLARKQLGIAITDQYTAYSYLGAGLQRHLLKDFPSFPIFASRLVDHPFGQKIDEATAALERAVKDLQRGIGAMQSSRT